MIVSKDTNPQKDVYYLGGLVIEILANDTQSDINFFDVFEKLNVIEKVSVNLFTLTLDWLYLIGAIGSNGEGAMIKCF